MGSHKAIIVYMAANKKQYVAIRPEILHDKFNHFFTVLLNENQWTLVYRQTNGA
jgi:hypothetical protein